MTTKKTRGGYRPGSGRPSLEADRGRLSPILVSLYPDQHDWLAGKENRQAAIRAAIDAQIQQEAKK
ncbi:MAG: hypothetical protein RBS34_00380 [Desulfofustis sp.]|jgi:hypothetical protein|nr:hypothetical protein [Desulfofustis sp.]